MNLILWMLLGHSLGDFYFQTKRMASEKGKYLFKHVIVYTATMMVIYWLVTRSHAVVFLGLIVMSSHFLIDRINLFLNRKYPNTALLIFILDQAFHLVILIGFLVVYDEVVIIGDQANHVLLLTTIIFYLIMPSSTLIDKVLSTVNKDQFPKIFVLDEGTVIGILERMLILVMGISGSISGIGLLVAAKTMVRYGQFDDPEKDSNFRSKYLIGTLLSVLIGFILYLCFDWLK